MINSKKLLTSDNIALSITEYLPLNPKAKVFISTGLSGTKEGKENILADLALKLYENNIKVIAYDYRGHGQSSGQSSDVTIETGLIDLNTILNAYTDSLPTYLFGWSYGAMLSLLVANQISNLKGLVLWSPALDFNRSFINNPNSLFGKDIIKQRDNDSDVINIEFNGFVLGKNFLKTVDNYNMKEMITNIKCPIYVIQALKEYVLDLNINRECKDLFTEYIELDAIHALLEKRDEAINKTIEWIF